LSLRAHEGGVRLEVRDDGRGLAPGWREKAEHDGGHYGLRWLQERVEVLGGRFSIDNAPPRGVKVEVWLPFSDNPEGDGEAAPAAAMEMNT
jgi:two-component system, NarL family, sensor kinase